MRNGALAVLMMLIGLTALGGCVVHDHRDGAVSAWTDGKFLKVQSFVEASNGVQAHP